MPYWHRLAKYKCIYISIGKGCRTQKTPHYSTKTSDDSVPNNQDALHY